MKSVAGKGFWITPQGEVAEVPEHVLTIKKNPGLFGFSSEDEMLKKPHEPREALIGEAISRGWVRVRLSEREGYQVNVWALDENTMERLKCFWKGLPAFYQSAPVSLTVLSIGKREQAQIGDLFKANGSKRKENAWH